MASSMHARKPSLGAFACYSGPSLTAFSTPHMSSQMKTSARGQFTTMDGVARTGERALLLSLNAGTADGWQHMLVPIALYCKTCPAGGYKAGKGLCVVVGLQPGPAAAGRH